MSTTRRQLLSRAAWGAGAVAMSSVVPRVGLPQSGAGELARRIHDDLVQHASFGDKFAGGPGDHATANWIAGRLTDSGYKVVESTFDAPFFVQRAARFSTGDTSAAVIPQAPVVPTDSRGITARLSLVDGGRGDVRGRIALILSPYGRHAALFPNRGFGSMLIEAAEAGAAAIVVVTNGPSGEAVALNCPEEPFVPIPTAVLAPKHADAFIAAARDEAHATLVLDGEATHRPSKNIIARIERGDRWLAMSTPRSGWFNCVAERGTGTAAFLQIADWAVQRYPEHSIFLMNTGGHEYFFAGSHRVLDQTPPPDRTDVWVHVGATLAARDAVQRDGEWVMLDTADPQRSVMATEAASAAAAEAFAGLSGLTPPGAVRTNAGELSTFTGLGFTTAFAVLGVHRWFHTVEDTLERVDARLVAPVLRAHQRTVELLVG